MDPQTLVPDLSSPEIQAFATGFPVMLMHAAVTLLLLIAGVSLGAVTMFQPARPPVRWSRVEMRRAKR